MVMPPLKPDQVVHPWSTTTGMISPPPARISIRNCESLVTPFLALPVTRPIILRSSETVITAVGGRNWILGNHASQIRRFYFDGWIGSGQIQWILFYLIRQNKLQVMQILMQMPPQQAIMFRMHGHGWMGRYSKQKIPVPMIQSHLSRIRIRRY